MIMATIKDLQNNIKKGYSLPLLEVPELRYINDSPVGRALFKNSTEISNEIGKKRGRGNTRPKTAKWNDKIKCPICGRIFFRSARSAHNKTKIHNAYKSMDNKLRTILFNID